LYLLIKTINRRSKPPAQNCPPAPLSLFSVERSFWETSDSVMDDSPFWRPAGQIATKEAHEAVTQSKPSATRLPFATHSFLAQLVKLAANSQYPTVFGLAKRSIKWILLPATSETKILLHVRGSKKKSKLSRMISLACSL
jgi:hypothetical protein